MAALDDWRDINQELVNIAGYSCPDPGMKQLHHNDRKYKIIDKMMQSTIRQHSGYHFTSYRIQKIELVRNVDHFKRYKQKREEIAKQSRKRRRANQRWLFHGSPHAQTIALNGFDQTYANSGGMFGAGIYFARDSSKSNQYAFKKNGCKQHGVLTCHSCVRQMLLCRVILGNHSTETTANTSGSRQGFDSVVAVPGASLNYHEYVIYKTDQALPYYLITYTLS